MKALVLPKLSGPEALAVQEVPDPEIKAGQTLVRVSVGGLNFADFMTTRGGYPGTPAPPLVVGREFAGVEAAGGKKHRVLIHAVAGGVGTAAVQIGRLLGVDMYGTSSSDEKLARVKELGLQHAINYKQHDYEETVKNLTHGEGVDAVFEMLGGEHTAKSLR